MIRGFILLLMSAFTFALSTVFAKLITDMSNVHAIELTFFRFSCGLLMVSAYIIFKKKSIRPNNKKYILMRSFFNTIAVIFFFLGVQHTTVSKSNLINMTYPVFVFLITPFLNKEKTSATHYLYLMLTMAGLYFVVIPNTGFFNTDINMGDLYALLSGIGAGFAITSLREARKYDSSHTILFYLMLIGTVINLIIVIPYFILPEGLVLFYVIMTTVCALTGQVCITIGYKYIKASAGSLVSSSRILFGIIFGVSLFSDPLTLRIASGGILIIISLVGVSGILNKKKVIKG